MILPLKIRVKVSKMGNSLRMTVPVDVARALDIKNGDYVDIGVSNNKMIIEKAT